MKEKPKKQQNNKDRKDQGGNKRCSERVTVK